MQYWSPKPQVVYEQTDKGPREIGEILKMLHSRTLFVDLENIEEAKDKARAMWNDLVELAGSIKQTKIFKDSEEIFESNNFNLFPIKWKTKEKRSRSNLSRS